MNSKKEIGKYIRKLNIKMELQKVAHQSAVSNSIFTSSAFLSLIAINITLYTNNSQNIILIASLGLFTLITASLAIFFIHIAQKTFRNISKISNELIELESRM